MDVDARYEPALRLILLFLNPSIVLNYFCDNIHLFELQSEAVCYLYGPNISRDAKACALHERF